ncbi:hypothetical protein BWQ96_01040 [Gracilariopsis chorda]|uniref:F-box domain-containing protein n=1 Tax=Gracilariopsis chorda TaxID=448386 RepID=A0A2V3J471_9FLOR|nr:hypothetical protein BWQ96_01040 [Gracilariopsis chorda]|eukprot:PXF49251.1 hypothetical protein BWQ96_01040 [Gracilariopsis chorda]
MAPPSYLRPATTRLTSPASSADEKAHRYGTPSPSTTIVVQDVSLALTRPVQLQLLSLPNDVLSRIVSVAISDSQRGVPYYPPIKSHTLLPLALSNKHLRGVVASTCVSDHGFIEAYLAQDDEDRQLQARMDLISFYRVQDGHLSRFFLHKKSIIPSDVRLYGTNIVLSTKPRLCELDITDVKKGGDCGDQVFESVTELLRISAPYLEVLHLSLQNKDLLEVVNTMSFPKLNTLSLRLPFSPSAASMESLFSTHGTNLHTLTLFCISNFPGQAVAQLPTFAPSITNLTYNSGMDPSVSSAFLSLVESYPKLESLSLNNCRVSEELCHTLSAHPNKPKLFFRRVPVENPASLLSSVPHLSETLFRADSMTLNGSDDIAAVLRFRNLEELHIRVHADVAPLVRSLSVLPKLKSLFISYHDPWEWDESTRAEVDRNIVIAVQAAKSLRQLVIYSPTMSFDSLQTIMISVGDRLEYLVSGIHTPKRSHSRCIMRLIRCAMHHSPNLKVLCFGLGLQYDRKVNSLQSQFERTIDMAEEKLSGLNTYWLRANLRSLLNIRKPADFVNYDSDGFDQTDGL